MRRDGCACGSARRGLPSATARSSRAPRSAVRLPNASPPLVARVSDARRRRAATTGDAAWSGSTGTSPRAGAPALVRALTPTAQRASAVPFRLEGRRSPARASIAATRPCCTCRAATFPALRAALTSLRRAAGGGAPAAASRRSRSRWRRASGWPRTTAPASSFGAAALRAARRGDRDAHERGASATPRVSRGRRALRRAPAWSSMRPTSSPARRPPCPLTAFLDAAAAIGRRIVADAVWDDGRCSWMGAARRARGPVGGPSTAPSARCSTTGTAGVGLFLAQLARGDRRDERSAGPPSARYGMPSSAPRRSARRARRLLRRDGRVSRGPRRGARAARRRRAPTVRARCSPPPVAGAAAAARCPDLVVGAAGTTALWRSPPRCDDPQLRRAAAAPATRCSTARGDDRTAGPGPTRAAPARHHLCGARARRGRDRLGPARAVRGDGRRALRAGGERRVRLRALLARPARRHMAGPPAPGPAWRTRAGYDRDLVLRGGRHRAQPPSRAIELLGDGPHCHDADIALETTRRIRWTRLPFAIDDLSLCHGLGRGGRRPARPAGIPMLLTRWARSRSDATASAATGPAAWTGRTPGLFRGLSGIGWFFLRLHDPTIPSPLAVPRAT